MIEPKNCHIFKSGTPTTYQTGLALLGGWMTHLYNDKDEKLLAATFDSEEDANLWSERMVSEEGTFPST